MTSSPSLASRPAAEDSADADLRHVGWVAGIWVLVAVFGVVTALWSHHVGVPLRDPGGSMFRSRLTSAADPPWWWWRSCRRWRLRAAAAPGPCGSLRDRWTWQRLALVLTGLVAYHLVYVCYRNLKSWDAFNTIRDDMLLRCRPLALPRPRPAVLLHDLLGQHAAAYVLVVVYQAFTYLVPLSLVASLVFVTADPRGLRVPRLRHVGVDPRRRLLLPDPDPRPVRRRAAGVFAGLPHTNITSTQAQYLAERAHMLADPAAPDAFASISAFASLHVGVTCMIWLMMRYYGLRRSSRVMAVYLALVMVATVYFGWHFFVDVVAGVLLAVLAVLLGRFTVYPKDRPTVVLRPSGGHAHQD